MGHTNRAIKHSILIVTSLAIFKSRIDEINFTTYETHWKYIKRNTFALKNNLRVFEENLKKKNKIKMKF